MGRYEVRREVAQGGFATVVEAWDEELASSVALKILHPQLAENDELQKKFLEEARLLRRVKCPNVVTVHDVGRLQDGRPYLVMDFADRGTLAERLKDSAGKASYVNLLEMIDALADGLVSVHAADIIHRDIKPANILFQSIRWRSPSMRGSADASKENASWIDKGERLLIGDLGIAKDLLAVSEHTVVAGTPLYKAPEQGEAGKLVSPSADIFSASAVLFNLITGERPPASHALSQGIEKAPEQWQDFLSCGMSLDPQKRFLSVDDWRKAAHQVLMEDETVAPDDGVTETQYVGNECPYKGLAAYQSDDANRFFGRERLVEDLMQRIQKEQVLIVGGPSGSGKSSVLRAGLLPRIVSGGLTGSETWQTVVMTPGRDPLAELYHRIVRALSLKSPSISLEQLLSRPSLARQLVSDLDSQQSIVLFIDQFEEIFTLTEIDQQTRFIEALAAMVDPADSRVKLVVALRADFYDSCANLPWLAQRISENQVLVGPMSEAELRRAITEPARQSGLFLENALTHAILGEATDEVGALPLVAHALVETWQRRSGKKLTLDGFREAGGVAGAISQTADEIFKDRLNEAEQQTCRRLFLRLVTSRHEMPDTRRIVTLDELEHDSEESTLKRVVSVLTDARLLTADASTVQITHEALLRTWPRLRGWIEESRDDLRFRQRISRAAREWNLDEKNPDLLYRGTPLTAAQEWVEKNPDQLDEHERNFLQNSEAARAKALALQQAGENRNRKLRNVAIALLTVFAIGASAASVVAFIAFRQSVKNEQMAREASEKANQQFARALGAAALGLVESDPLLALALGNESVSRVGNELASYDGRAAMLRSRVKLNEIGPFVSGSPIPAGDARILAVSDDGSVIATGRRDGSIQLYSAESRSTLGDALQGHSGGIEGLDFSSDGQRLVSVDGRGEMRIWDISNKPSGTVEVVANGSGTFWAAEFSPDNTSIATAGEDGMVRLWDVQNGQQLGEPLAARQGNFSSVAFDRSGRMLIAGNSDGEIYSVGPKTPSPLFKTITSVHSSDVWELEFNQAGDIFATGSSDGTSRLISYPDAVNVGAAFTGQGKVQGISFTPTDSMLIGGTPAGEIMVWSVEEERLVAVSARGHSRAVLRTDIDASGKQLTTLGNDQQIRIWKFSDQQNMSGDYRLEGEMAKAKGVSISPDGRYLAVGDSLGRVGIWLLDVRQAPLMLQRHEKGVWALGFDKSSSYLLSADRDGQIKLQQTADGKEVLSISTDIGSLWSAEIAPDGDSFYVAGDNEVRKYDFQSGELLMTFASQLPGIVNANLSPSGKYLAVSGKNGHVEVLNYESGDLVHDLIAGDDVIWNLTFSADEQLLATTSADEVVKLWQLKTGEAIGSLTGHSGGVTDALFLHDNTTLVSVDRSGALHLWDITGNRPLMPPIKAHSGASWRLALHPDGETFVSTGDDGVIRLWDLMNRDKACEITSGVFDELYRRQYLGQNQQAVACEALP